MANGSARDGCPRRHPSSGHGGNVGPVRRKSLEKSKATCDPIDKSFGLEIGPRMGRALLVLA
jgi:hypothetical protein